MICRHDPRDPNCSSNQPKDYGYDTYAPTVHTPPLPSAAHIATDPGTPDPTDFDIEEVEAVGQHLVMKVRYPNCTKCSYEGNKVMVFFNTSYKDVLRWRQLDPHFRDPSKVLPLRAAPSPDARFPASLEGWRNALAFTAMMVKIT